MKSRFWNWFIIIASCVALVVYLFATEGRQTIAQVFASMDYWWIAGGIASMVLCWLADAFLLYAISKEYKGEYSYWFIFRCSRVGVLFGLISPMQSGMIPTQMVMLAQGGMRTGDSATAILFKNILLTLASTLLQAGFLIWKGSWLWNLSQFLCIIIFIALFASVLYLLFLLFVGKAETLVTRFISAIIRLLGRIHILKDPQKTQDRAFLEIVQMHLNFSKIRMDSWKSIGLLVVSIAQMVFFTQTTYFIYRSFGLNGQGFMTIMAGQTFISAIQSIIPLPGGVGVTDSGFYTILNVLFGVDKINFALVIWRLLTFYLPIMTGMSMLFTYRRKEKKRLGK
ncbi:MAG: YbhN family protein [Sphaerochaetaceae bacterium]